MENSQQNSNPDLFSFLSLQKSLLSLERDAEQAENQQLILDNDSKTLQDMGLALINIKLKSIKVGFFGKTLLTLVSINFFDKAFKSQEEIPENQKILMKLPRTRFGTGDLVSLYESCGFFSEKSPLLNALVFKITEFKLVLILEKGEQAQSLDLEVFQNNKKKLAVMISSNEVTYNRHLKIIEKIPLFSSDISHPSNRILRLFLSNSETTSFTPNEIPLVLNDKSLNSEQKIAVEKALTAKDFFLIHGPPGTGKTKTLIEIIYQLTQKNLRVLACGPSNVSVDNIAERLSRNIKVVRVGNPVRLKPEILDKSLDYLLKKCEIANDIKSTKRSIKDLLRKLSKSPKEQKFDLRKSINALRKELKELEKLAIREIFSEAQVILSTNTTAADKLLTINEKFKAFDVVIIDEAAQALEISCWIPILSGKKVILAGDHKQLPPTIKSKEASDKGYSRTLFERLSENTAYKDFSLTLRVQYRMNEKIMNWSSQYVYQGLLEADETAKARSIKEFSVLMFIDTDGSNMGESSKSVQESLGSKPNVSKSNRGEADLVLLVLKELIVDQGVGVGDIGVITPYNSQVALIKMLVEKESTIGNTEKLEVSTVDGFQGREKEAIIISMVRSNPKREIGFLREFRRMNVAITRAKRFVCLIGDKETVKGDQFLNNLVEYFETYGEYRVALQYKGIYDYIHFNEGWYGEKTEKIEKIEVGEKKKKKNKKKNKDKKEKEASVYNEINGKNNENKEEQKREPNNNNDNEDGENSKLEKLKEEIEAFFEDSERTMMELPGLNSFFRLKAHEIAESCHLLHESKGEGANRKLILTKKVVNQTIPEEEIKNIDEKTTKNIENAISKDFMPKNPEKPAAKVINPNPPKPKPPKKPKEKIQDSQTEDEFLDQMIQMNKSCNFMSCPAKVHVIYSICKYCDREFCYKHALAETHGCGDKASYDAQIKFKKDYEKKTFGDMSAKPEEKEYLKMKMQQKLKSSQQDRTSKPKKEKKK